MLPVTVQRLAFAKQLRGAIVSLFQRRHYEWLARFAGQHLTSTDWCELANQLKHDNPQFKPDRFLDACEAAMSVHIGRPIG